MKIYEIITFDDIIIFDIEKKQGHSIQVVRWRGKTGDIYVCEKLGNGSWMVERVSNGLRHSEGYLASDREVLKAMSIGYDSAD